MESACAVAMFMRSIDQNLLRCTEYIGDGDTSSYKDVTYAKPYGNDINIMKKECLGHVQKRMGTRLRNLRKAKKGVLIPGLQRSGIAGIGRLSDKNINLLQNYYGMAIRQNNDNIYQMKKAIGATLYHCTALEENIRHQFCPQTVDSWCKWQSDKITGMNTYTPRINLPEAIKDILWSADSSQSTIFRDLSDDVLLAKCLHNYIQNQNEALNSVIWKKCPKDIFVKKDY